MLNGKITFGRKEPEPVVVPRTTPRAPRKAKENYRPAREGDLYQALKDAIEKEFDVDPETLKRMKSGFARKPFGGDRKGGGGWNSTAYAVFEAIEKSGRFYIKKE